jgi:hypothetical protein
MIIASAAIESAQTLLRSDHITAEQLLTLLRLRYTQLYETTSWAMRRREFMISTTALVSSTDSETVTVTLDSSTVTSAGTPFTAAMSGRMIRIGDEVVPFYLTFVSSSVVTLQDGEGTAVTWPRATDPAASWTVFQTVYSLPADAGAVLHLGTDVALLEIDGGRATLNQMDPNRESVDSQPTRWCYAGVTATTGTTPPSRQIEIWPVPSAGRIIHGEYQRDAPTLTMTSVIDMPAPIVIYGLIADGHNALFSFTGDEAHEKAGLFYERKMGELIQDYGPVEQHRLSIPRHFGIGLGQRLAGDYLVDHQSPAEFPR